MLKLCERRVFWFVSQHKLRKRLGTSDLRVHVQGQKVIRIGKREGEKDQLLACNSLLNSSSVI